MVEEHPGRIPYVDALNHLTLSDAVLVLGSTEPHYTPSKVFQAMLSGRPVLAMLHEDSSAWVEMIRSTHAGTALVLTEKRLCRVRTKCLGCAPVLDCTRASTNNAGGIVDGPAFEAHSARGSARALAAALDLACERRGAGLG